MRIRFPLLAKILTWLFLNLVLLTVVFLVIFRAQFRFGLDAFLSGRSGERLQAIGETITGELKDKPVENWGKVLNSFREAYHVDFLLFRSDATQLTGETLILPSTVSEKVAERHMPGEGMGRGPPPGRGFRRMWESTGPNSRFALKTSKPTRYWLGQRLSLTEPDANRPSPLTLLVVSGSARVGGLFIDYTPWLWAGFGALLLSVLFWLPLVRSVTRSLAQMTRATESIAEGQFDVRVNARRTDELGQLAQAINQMAGRLSGFVSGQKRFLGDIAHELCSPLARIQVALGILEQRADERQKPYLEDLHEEVQAMSALVNELLSFSKAGLAQKKVQLGPVNVAEVVRGAVARESQDSTQLEVKVEEGLTARADADLLTRALANLLRNAARYAGSAGPVTVAASQKDSSVTLVVADEGPGVPEPMLQQIFDPFFRGEPSRSRDTGGVGLGLAIVKTCVEACDGTVQARNRTPHGLEVVITLQQS